MRVWWYMAGEVRKGPISQSQLEGLFESGDVSDATMVWCEGLSDWQPISAIDESTLPALDDKPAPSQNQTAEATQPEPEPETSTEVSSQSAAEQQKAVQAVAPIAEFQGLTGTIDIIEVKPATIAEQQPILAPAPENIISEPAAIVSSLAATPIVAQSSKPVSAAIEQVLTRQVVAQEEQQDKGAQVHAQKQVPAPEAEQSKVVQPKDEPLAQHVGTIATTVASSPVLAQKSEDISSSSFLETARRGTVKRKKTAAVKASDLDAKNQEQEQEQENKKKFRRDFKKYFSARYIIAGLAGLIALVWLSIFLLGGGGSSQALNSWTNPKTFNQIALDPQWSVTTSVNAEEQIFYRFTHQKNPLIVRFGEETFPDKTSLTEYSELFSMAIENEMTFEKEGVEEVILGSETLSFAGHLVKDPDQKVNVTFLKSGEQIWRILVINTSGGRPKTKSFQILRGKLIDSIH